MFTLYSRLWNIYIRRSCRKLRQLHVSIVRDACHGMFRRFHIEA